MAVIGSSPDVARAEAMGFLTQPRATWIRLNSSDITKTHFPYLGHCHTPAVSLVLACVFLSPFPVLFVPFPFQISVAFFL